MDILRRPSATLADRVRRWFQGPDLSQFADRLEYDGSVAEYFGGPNQAPKPRMIHIYVQVTAQRKWQDVNCRYRSASVALLSLSLLSLLLVSSFFLLIPKSHFIQLPRRFLSLLCGGSRFRRFRRDDF